MSNHNEQIERALGGDEDVLAELLSEHRDRILRMVQLRMDMRIRGRVDPSDVVQEAFVEISRRVKNKTFDPKIPFFLWIRMVAGDRLAVLHREHLGVAKRNVNREVGLQAVGLPDQSSVYLARELAGQFSSVDRGLRQEEIRGRLQDALKAMEERDREIIAMRFFEELSTEEIATVLGLSRSGVLKRCTRALRRLGQQLGADMSI